VIVIARDRIPKPKHDLLNQRTTLEYLPRYFRSHALSGFEQKKIGRLSANASWPIAYRALLERAGSRQSADGGRVDGIGPRNIGHRIAQGHVRYQI
jgi:hypothetical protein